MTIAVTCRCGRKLQFDEERAGKRAKCPECGEPVEIPAATAVRAGSPKTAVRAGSPKTAGGKNSRPQRSRMTWVLAGVGGGAVLLGSACCVVAILGYVFRDVWLPGAREVNSPEALFASIETAVKKNKIQVDEKGILVGDNRFQDVPPEGAILIGFETNVTPFAGQPRVESVRPIFLTQNGETFGPWHGPPAQAPTVVKAKPGYVVGSLTIRTTVFLTGLSLTYVKLEGGKLQPADSYTSEWVGSMQGGMATSGGPGLVPVGISGRLGFGKDVCALGLVLMSTKK
jgi:hypothetical protein